ncbi:CD209 antigen-like protein E isoform X2 [Labeo rohita]|uniref:CD209 antigen-like protein E isoform X1 n=1 Tax=Labeo rohita TaxID=84645 RepID=UPI0021E31F17|nr:CD209 antigen-like protein E isoform X1 [Labeo rohita]XP_050976831.1 CD209 antigen-like protein E isoform X2 [Labeo rohita]
MKFDGERSETPECIYQNVDTVGRPDLRITEKQQPLQHTGSDRKHRAAEVCLCLLCFLLLIAVIVLCVCFTTERHQLLTHISNLTEEREQIMEHNNNLTQEREQILTKYEQMLNRNKRLTKERVQIMKNNSNLIEEKKQLKNDKNRVYSWLSEQDQQREPIKWMYYNFSFYYISSEKKSWIDSRRDCQQRGADLAILNKDNEQSFQKFLQKVAETENFWIGLINTEKGWKWINGTLTPNGSGNNNCGAVGATANFRFSCDTTHRWICERTLNNH